MAQPPLPARKPGGEGADPAPDPSMDDILASIRRILDDDGAAKPPGSDVLMLDASMMVDDAATGDTPSPEPAAIEPPAPRLEDTIAMSSAPSSSANPIPSPALPPAVPAAPPPSPPLPAMPSPAGSGAEAAAQSVGALMRTLAAERRTTVGRSGVTIEDLVREEIRPLLTAWLDTHLPPIVERAVQAEIERIVARQAG